MPAAQCKSGCTGKRDRQPAGCRRADRGADIDPVPEQEGHAQRAAANPEDGRDRADDRAGNPKADRHLAGHGAPRPVRLSSK